ncbi:tRNA glutamyl-Q(34) synthetase GluQRS [Xenorhabdus nematophila]|uniref:tRNA glutamyl-Q(34) synthetase GluQRS n=2 Tax=Xenorhabdus nematophila TaxID=628 RepID=UPI0003275C31|nr:tRNA glutamyl-Q(34) synthetase GluQRS [Xenorhabdus nematophila]CEE93199.1 putative glutamyl t-RNA synthetase with nucleotidylyl transferase domain [Xenorhabdus nematophila str. Anatoliense]CEF29352.1 putative glutamyl t-RNA synthetase with nucleotidylyl transferase domain [Xenorhabdus nematophila str. Websteri]CCW32684.1 Glutamyl-Q tRNA(Asp) synthetase [Xenorhabdus nematophila F1]CEE93784.1 putative glutamyl t-RNA synthetase with nucleotidylyl transferase domain [Xenorhabdus nematophila str.
MSPISIINMTQSEHSSLYIGRFAPSPSGDLHFGSLVTALGSYLQARACRGKWLMRIDDIDPPREIAGAAGRILKSLEHYGLYWDGEVLYQSQRHEAYRTILEQLKQQEKSYSCTCTRQRIQQLGGFYDGYCQYLSPSANHAAIRLKQHYPVYGFHDKLQGYITVHKAMAEEDFIIHRKDGFFAYNLVVVIDDNYQGVTEIVRGADLIEPTVRQLSLYQHLNFKMPDYVHLPLVLNTEGNKLSKQNHAQPIHLGDPRPLLINALSFLNQPAIAGWQDLTTEQLLGHAIAGWNINTVPPEKHNPSPI